MNESTLAELRKQAATACDDLNNVLTAIMLRAGMLENAYGQEIEQLSMRAKVVVVTLRDSACSEVEWDDSLYPVTR